MFDDELQDEVDYLELLEHEENTRAMDYHLENVSDAHQVKGWYK